jgi:hypothetical protein
VVYESSDPANGGWDRSATTASVIRDNKTIFEMEGFGDHLYVGTLNLEGYQIWRSTCDGEPPYVFEKVIDKGAYRGKLNQCALSMATFKGALYVGSGIQGGGVDTQNKVGPAPPELIRIHPDGDWDLIVGDSRDTPDGQKDCLSGYLPGFDNFFNGYLWRLCEHDGWLYASSFEWTSILGYANRRGWPEAFTNIINHVDPQTILDNHSGFDLYRSFDGENWVPVTTNGMDNPYNMGPAHDGVVAARPVPRHRQSLRPEDHAARRRSLRAESARRLRDSISQPASAASDAAPGRRGGGAGARPDRDRGGAAGRRPRGGGPRLRPGAGAASGRLPAGLRPDRGDPGHRPRGAWAIGDKANPAVVAAKVAHWLPAGLVVVSSTIGCCPTPACCSRPATWPARSPSSRSRAAGWAGRPGPPGPSSAIRPAPT